MQNLHWGLGSKKGSKIITNTYWVLAVGSPCCNYFMCIIFNSHHHAIEQVLLFPSHYRWGNLGAEKLNDFPTLHIQEVPEPFQSLLINHHHPSVALSTLVSLCPGAIYLGVNRLFLIVIGSLDRSNFLSRDNDSRGKFYAANSK